jgi:hypothetical protein
MRTLPVSTLVAEMHVDAFRASQTLEIDVVFQHGSQRIEVERIELIWRKRADQRVEHPVRRRLFDRDGGAERIVQRTHGIPLLSRLGNRFPECGQAFAGDIAVAAHHRVGDHHRIHRAGAGRADRFDVDTAVFEHRVEHAPRERTVRAAALQGEIHRPLRGTGFPGGAHVFPICDVPLS